MAHLAGSICGVCNQALFGVNDGVFCSRCEVPVHKNCFPKVELSENQSVCSKCGSSLEYAKQWQARLRKDEQVIENAMKPPYLRRVLFGLFGLFFLLSVYLMVFAGMSGGFVVTVPGMVVTIVALAIESAFEDND
jgi:hypothetical protein